MNYVQFSLFISYVLSVLLAGHGVRRIIERDSRLRFNRFVYLGETLLLGSIILYAQMLLISFTGLYKAPYLWGAVLLNFLFLLNRRVRNECQDCLFKRISLDIPLTAFFILTGIFIFRNCYYLVDVDSHSTYLYTQKLWLAHGTSLIGNTTTDTRVFIPQFDALPYGLGLSIFPNETLFPALINLFWRLIVLILVFGYTSFRFNRWHGLGSVTLVLFNDHYFYSGVNTVVVINAAVIAFVFAAAYHFWECRRRNDLYHFFLALIFASQLISNKYQMAYILFFMIGMGIVIQRSVVEIFRYMLDKRRLIIVVTAYIIAALWYLKNWIVTGLPTFPILAGRFSVFDWQPDKEHVFLKIYGGLDLLQVLKYLSYLFVWPGINPLKYVWLSVVFLPLSIIISASKNKIDSNRLFELTYWLGLSILFVVGICLAMHQDPRYYRYGIAIFSFTSVYSLNYFLLDCFRVNNSVLSGAVILLLSIPGYKLMFSEGGVYKRPFMKDNFNVILNKIQMDNIIDRYFLESRIAQSGFSENKEKAVKSAWEIEGNSGLSAFLLPIQPQVNLWYTTAVKWNSYKSADLIIQDLNKHGIEWVMRVKDDKFVFVSAEEYAKEALHFDLYPKATAFNYGFPKELNEVKY